MWEPGRAYSEAYQGPIDAGIENGHIVFFIHGGLNDLPGVVGRIRRFSDDDVEGFKGQPWHLIHLAWDTDWGAAIDDVVLSLNTWKQWRNILRLLSIALPWNWFGWRRAIKGPVAHFGGIAWKSEYDTAVAATSAPQAAGTDRDSGFYRAIKYLSQRVAGGEDIQISFVVHSAGSIVANYLLSLIASEFPNLAAKVRNYILMAPACHIAHFEQGIKASQPPGQTAVLTLSPHFELEDDIKVYDKSLLWGIYDLFEANWKEKDFRRFDLPLDSAHAVGDVRNRGLLGLEEQVAELAGSAISPLDRSFGADVEWAETDVDKPLGAHTSRVWTTSRRHGGFDGDAATLESIRTLLG